MSHRQTLGVTEFAPGDAILPANFGERLDRLKERSGLTWEAMAEALGVDSRQIGRWRQGVSPSGGAMLALALLAIGVPGGLSELLGEDVTDVRRRGRNRR